MIDLPREKVWHVKGFGNGIEGLSPLGAARESAGFALAMQEFGSRFFSQGGMPAGIVSIPGQLNKTQREEARENLQRVLAGLGNAHKFALFEQGMKPEAWGNTPLKDMEFMMLMQFSVPEICRFFRVPPHMVADLSRATFSNIEHLSQEFVMFTLMPYFTRIEASVSRWLMRPRERGKLFLRFNFEGLLRADSKGRAEFYASALQNGWMNRNEVRGKEKFNRVEGLDGYTVQTNMAPVDKLEGLADAQIKKANQPPPQPGFPSKGKKE
jgi:HK97 family phage portal protein